MEIVKLSSSNQEEIIKKTLAVLTSGGLVVFPTDTVYGLLCDATNSQAIDKLLSFKERPAGKAISVFVADKEMAEKYVVINLNAANIIKNLLPGPFTVICSARPRLASLQGEALKKVDPRLFAENNTLGFRIPDYPLINKLLMAYSLPLTATSANKSGTPPHYSIESFLCPAGCHPVGTQGGTQGDTLTKNKKFDLIDLIIDAGKLPYNKPSTVIDTTSGELKTLRFGDLVPNTPNSFISRKEKETSELAGFILSKVIKTSSGKPICFLLKGELGTGKTVFTKGLAKALGIKETVVSPTYTLCYEYRISTKIPWLSTDQPIENGSEFDTKRLRHNNKLVQQVYQNSNLKTQISKPKLKTQNFLIHYDLYRIESSQDLKEIKFLESIKPCNIYSIEWPERLDEKTLSKLKEIARVVYIEIKHIDEKTREVKWGN